MENFLKNVLAWQGENIFDRKRVKLKNFHRNFRFQYPANKYDRATLPKNIRRLIRYANIERTLRYSFAS